MSDLYSLVLTTLKNSLMKDEAKRLQILAG